MMHLIDGVMLSVGSSPAASLIAKATLAVALGIAGARLARGSRAAVRHAVLTAAFGVLLLLPIVSAVTPPLRIVVEEASSGLSTPAPAGTTSVAGVSQAPTRREPSLSALLLWGWMAGTALFLIPMAMGLRHVRSLRRSALPWPRGQALASELAATAGIRRGVDVLLGAGSGPMTCGVMHPAIVLCAEAENWTEDDLTRALVHELEHVRRADRMIHCVARAVCAAYWLHPLVWLAWRQLELEAERSCDDAVLARSEAAAYAEQLVELARRLTKTKGPLLAMANRADLSARVSAMLDPEQRHGRAGRVPWTMACLAAAAFVFTMSPLTTIAAPQPSTANSGGNMALLLVRTDLVTVNVSVSDAQGIDVGGLKPADFEVTEDGVPQKVSVFEYHSSGPIFGRRTRYYVLGYYARTRGAAYVNGEFRKIAIVLRGNSKAMLKYRSGYYSGSPADNSFAAVPDTKGVKYDPAMRPPAVIFKKDPEYSEEARKARFQGAVALNAVVDTSGHASNIKVTRSLGLGLDEKATEALRQWRFRPGTKDGHPVASPVQVAVDFRLP